jgi:arsenate reductase (thioredoxin)
MTKTRILIICTGNAARSQMAEGLFRDKAGDRIEVFSAGTHPASLHPLAVEAMREIGIDISRQYSKSVDTFRDQKFDCVITVCDSARQECPIFPGSPMLHWSTPDPDSVETFRSTRDLLAQRIDQFLRNHRDTETRS